MYSSSINLARRVLYRNRCWRTESMMDFLLGHKRIPGIARSLVSTIAYGMAHLSFRIWNEYHAYQIQLATGHVTAYHQSLEGRSLTVQWRRRPVGGRKPYRRGRAFLNVKVNRTRFDHFTRPKSYPLQATANGYVKEANMIVLSWHCSFSLVRTCSAMSKKHRHLSRRGLWLLAVVSQILMGGALCIHLLCLWTNNWGSMNSRE